MVSRLSNKMEVMKVDIKKAKKQFELVKDTETFVITTVTFKSLLEEIEYQKNQWESLKPVYDKVFDDRDLLIKKVERYEKALTYLSDCTNYMDLDFVLDHVEEVAKEALKEK